MDNYNKKNILIIGMGSVGRRRTQLLQQQKYPCTVFGVDPSLARREQAAEELGICCYESLEQAQATRSEFFAAFVCNPPLLHSDIEQIHAVGGNTTKLNIDFRITI